MSSSVCAVEPDGASALIEPDPYRRFRLQGRANVDIEGHSFLVLVNYEDVKSTPRHWRAFTSDTPFEVPIPHEHNVRTMRQLPIETDPPLHTQYCRLIEAPFTRAAVEAHVPPDKSLFWDLNGWLAFTAFRHQTPLFAGQTRDGASRVQDLFLFDYIHPSANSVIVKLSANQAYDISSEEHTNRDVENTAFLRGLDRGLDDQAGKSK